jgi:hypothetical protein
MVGERFPAGMPPEDKRAMLTLQPNMHRGTPAGIARAVQKWLTGNRVVQILERTMPDGTADPNGDHFIVYTYAAETPYPNLVLQEIEAQTPYDMVAAYHTVTGPSWAAVQDAYGPTWTTIQQHFPTWDAMEGSEPGASIWTWTT